jgi:hypothetical protein
MEDAELQRWFADETVKPFSETLRAIGEALSRMRVPFTMAALHTQTGRGDSPAVGVSFHSLQPFAIRDVSRN